MAQWQSGDEIIGVAIENERKAAAFYTDIAEKMATPAMRSVFEAFAREERRHEDKLEGIRRVGTIDLPTKKVLDLKVSDYLVVGEPTADMDYQQALILAMKQEKAAFRLYSDLASITGDPELRGLLEFLAQEEARHKLRFEIEYEDHYLDEA